MIRLGNQPGGPLPNRLRSFDPDEAIAIMEIVHELESQPKLHPVLSKMRQLVG